MQAIEDNHGVTTGKLFLDLFRNQPKLCAIAVLLAILLPFCSGLTILLTIPILNSVDISLGPSTSNSIGEFFRSVFATIGVPQSLLGALFVFISTSTIQAMLLWYQLRVNARLRVKFVVGRQKRLNEAIGAAQWLVCMQVRPQDVAHSLSVEADRVLKGLKSLLSLVSNVSLAVVYLLFSACLSAAMTMVVAFVGLVLTPFVMPMVRSSRGSGVQLSRLTRQFYRDVLDHLAGVKEAKSMDAESRHAVEFETVADLVAQTRLRFESAKGASHFVFSFGTAVGIGFSAYLAVEVLKIPIVNLFLLIIIYSRLTPRLLKIQSDFQDIVYMLPAYANMINLQRVAESAAENRPDESSGRKIPFKKSIELTDVGFRYQNDADVWALLHINLTFAAGSVTAIVGHSGSGKSTLADLLLGLLHPAEGQITADGTNIHNHVSSWRRLVGYVPQDTFLLHDTIRANLLWANPKATADDISEALRLASVDDVVAGLPDGLETIVGERGLRLSGGERQRIALARAMLRKPSVLILDEATSSLDAENQEKVMSALRTLHGKLTVILIAHRMSTVRSADQIVILDQGHVVAQGRFEELRAKNDRFRKLINDEPLPMAS
ncbi:MAG: ABC transporter ATP-binding protein [Fuerstiella sp.]